MKQQDDQSATRVALGQIQEKLNESGRLYFATADCESLSHALRPEEARLLSPSATAKRRREFQMGRAAAHLALKKLSQPSAAIRMDEKGAPIWPPNIVGSISHTDSLAVAAVGWQKNIRSIGIDIENHQGRRSPEFFNLVCTESEQLWLNQLGEKKDLYTILVFSAKESIYKALYPLIGKSVDYHDIEFSKIDKAEIIIGYSRKDLGREWSKGSVFSVQHWILHTIVLTLVLLERDNGLSY